MFELKTMMQGKLLRYFWTIYYASYSPSHTGVKSYIFFSMSSLRLYGNTFKRDEGFICKLNNNNKKIKYVYLSYFIIIIVTPLPPVHLVDSFAFLFSSLVKGFNIFSVIFKNVRYISYIHTYIRDLWLNIVQYTSN